MSKYLAKVNIEGGIPVECILRCETSEPPDTIILHGEQVSEFKDGASYLVTTNDAGEQVFSEVATSAEAKAEQDGHDQVSGSKSVHKNPKGSAGKVS